MDRKIVSEYTRDEVWQSILDVARLSRYYHALANRYILAVRILRIILLLAAFSSVLTFVVSWPSILLVLLSLVIAGIVIFDMVSNYSEKVAVLYAINLECNHLESRWQQLWLDINNEAIDDSEAKRQINALTERITSVTGWSTQAHIREDGDLNEKCTEDAYKVIADKYKAA